MLLKKHQRTTIQKLKKKGKWGKERIKNRNKLAFIPLLAGIFWTVMGLTDESLTCCVAFSHFQFICFPLMLWKTFVIVSPKKKVPLGVIASDAMLTSNQRGKRAYSWWLARWYRYATDHWNYCVKWTQKSHRKLENCKYCQMYALLYNHWYWYQWVTFKQCSVQSVKNLFNITYHQCLPKNSIQGVKYLIWVKARSVPHCVNYSIDLPDKNYFCTLCGQLHTCSHKVLTVDVWGLEVQVLESLLC